MLNHIITNIKLHSSNMEIGKITDTATKTNAAINGQEVL